MSDKRIVSHCENVDKDKIDAKFDKGRKNRYLLTIPFLGEETRDKIMSIILKNPSKANEFKADVTINRAENYVYTNFPDVGNINVLNLFPYMATDAKDLQKYLDQTEPKIIQKELEINNQAIQKAISSSDYIIAAWGTNTKLTKSIYDERIEDVKNLLSSARAEIFRVINPRYPNNSEYPFHAQGWGYENSYTKLDL